MEHSYDSVTDDDSPNPGRKIIMHPLYLPRSSPWFELRVFYVRLSNCEVDDYTPEHLTLNHIPLAPDTILEVNGKRSGIYSDCVFSSLRRDRVDKKSDEATFVSTDSLRMTGSVRFEVYDKDDLLLCGVLELCNGNGYVKESKNHSKKWNMKCQSSVSPGSSFLKGKQYLTADVPSPTIEVYVAGCFSGTPIILTKTLQLGFRKKHQMKAMLDCIPEFEGTTDMKKESPFEDPLQVISFIIYIFFSFYLNSWQNYAKILFSIYRSCRLNSEFIIVTNS